MKTKPNSFETVKVKHNIPTDMPLNFQIVMFLLRNNLSIHILASSHFCLISPGPLRVLCPTKSDDQRQPRLTTLGPLVRSALSCVFFLLTDNHIYSSRPNANPDPPKSLPWLLLKFQI